MTLAEKYDILQRMRKQYDAAVQEVKYIKAQIKELYDEIKEEERSIPYQTGVSNYKESIKNKMPKL